MDVREFDRDTADMDEEDIDSTFLSAVQGFNETPNTPPPPPVVVPAGLELNAQPQPIDSNGGSYNDCVPLGEVPEFEELLSTSSDPYDGAVHAEDMQPDYPCSQAGSYSQGQYLPFMSSQDGATSAAAVGHAAAAAAPPPPPPVLVPAELELNAQPQPIDSNGGSYNDCVPLGYDPKFEELWSIVSDLNDGAVHAEDMQPDYPCSQAGSYSQGQNNDLPVVRLREGQKMQFIGVLPDGKVLYRVEEDHFAPPVLTAPPPNASTSKKRKFYKQQDDRPYVGKPLNAFMLFMKEQRAEVKLSEGNKSGGNAAVNTILGQRWSSMTSEDQAKYYAMAQKEKELHAQQHPDWCSKNNYGNKRKRKRGKASV